MLAYLTRQFFIDYASCSEIMKKESRPYLVLLVRVYDIDVAIPFRSNIKHENVYWTDKANRCGLDFSKAVIITDKNKYIDLNSKVQIRSNEYKRIKGKEYFIESKMKTFINLYKKAYINQKNPRNINICRYSTMQYFHKEIGIKKLKK